MYLRFFVIPLIGASAALTAAPEQKVTLRNSVAPELATTHEITTILTRRTDRAGVREDAVVRLKARNVRLQLDESKVAQVKAADMTIMLPGEVVSLHRDGKPVARSMGIEAFGLPTQNWVRLVTQLQTLHDGPAIVPDAPLADLPLLTAMLDVAHWPRQPVPIGERWSRPFETPEFAGTQHFELKEALRVGDDSAVAVHVRIEGRFQGLAAGTFAFERAETQLVWAKAERIVLRLTGAATYMLLRDENREPRGVQVDMVLKNRERLSEEAQDEARESLSAFARALAEFKAGRHEKAVTAAVLFRERWPRGVWLPAIDYLEQEALRRDRGGKPLASDDLKRALAALVDRWKAADAFDDVELAERNARAMREVLELNERQIRAMMRDDDERLRALAVFAWSFGESPDHLNDVARATRDASPQVRAWAANGLAARGNPDTDPELLLSLVNDSDATVRARGCVAVRRCNPPGEPLAGRLRERLLALILDPDKPTRLASIQAFVAAGSGPDLPDLRLALKVDRDPDCRKALEEAIERIERR
ncbi:MAG: HEAT repeat domain-containing protein [Phycisphaerae bacterium]|nr:HEAT repeat domain-containing protein [Phycisphaerae bacterium]